MRSPKEKAKELVKKFTEFHYVGYSDEITPDIDTAKNTQLLLLKNV